MQRQEKQIAAAQLARELREGSAVFTFDYRGLTVDEVNDVRRRVRESGGVYRVVKNSTARWALKDVGISGLDEHLSGMTGFAWSPEDPISLAKALHESAKEYEAFPLQGGASSATRRSVRTNSSGSPRCRDRTRCAPWSSARSRSRSAT